MYLNSNAIVCPCAYCILCQAVIFVTTNNLKCGSYIATLKKDLRILAYLAKDNTTGIGYFLTIY